MSDQCSSSRHFSVHVCLVRSPPARPPTRRSVLVCLVRIPAASDTAVYTVIETALPGRSLAKHQSLAFRKLSTGFWPSFFSLYKKPTDWLREPLETG